MRKTTASKDEAFTEYGLIAETIEWPDDRSWVAFKIRKEYIISLKRYKVNVNF